MNRRAAGGLARAGAPTPAVAAGKRGAALIVLALTLHGGPAAAQPAPPGPTPATAQPSPAAAGPTPATAQPSPAAAGPTPATAQPSPAAAGPTPATTQPAGTPAAPEGPAPAGPAAGPVPAAPQAAPLVVPPPASTTADFTVGDIKIEGLQRVSEGTVYNYLPVNIGDHLTPQRVREAIRALYVTGFFRDVQMRRDGNTLIVVVLERPSIESFEITGNKDIKTEDLQKSLRGVGLAAGKTFDRSVLEDVTQYLTDQYFARGKYGVRIESKVEEEAGNRVKIKIDIKEGSRAKIREINIVGDTKFKQKDILETLELKTPNWLSWYKQDDRYSRESLQGDLEKVRNYYMDRGYANFQLESTQVAIAPEKEDIFITVNIEEGQVYKVSQIKLAGTFVVPQSQLRAAAADPPGRHLQPQADHRLAGADAEPHGTRRLRLRQGRPGADRGQRQPHRGADLLRRSGQPRVRAQHQLHGHQPHQRRGAAPRDAPARGRLAVEHLAGALQAAHPASAVREERGIRDHPGGRLARPGGRELQDRGGAGVAALRRHRLLGDLQVHAQRQLRGFRLPRQRSAHRGQPERRRLQQGLHASSTPTRIPMSTTCSAPNRSPTAT